MAISLTFLSPTVLGLVDWCWSHCFLYLEARLKRRSSLFVPWGAAVALLSRHALTTQALACRLVTPPTHRSQGVALTWLAGLAVREGLAVVSGVAVLAELAVTARCVMAALEAHSPTLAARLLVHLHVKAALGGVAIALTWDARVRL